MRVKKAVIVAAGLSSRLYPLTLDQPKGLLPIAGSQLLLRSIALLKTQGITQIAIVTGYWQEQIMAACGGEITYITNPFYRQCNNMGSLWFAKAFVGEDPFLYLHGDIIYDEAILADTLAHFENGSEALVLTTDFGLTDDEAMKVKVQNGRLLESSKTVSEADGEWIGIAACRISKLLFSAIERIMLTDALNYYDTYAFTQLAATQSVVCIPTGDRNWVEIDFLEDYQRAQRLFGH